MTRLKIAAMIATLGAAPAAHAYDALGAVPVQDDKHSVVFDTISVTGPATVLVYDTQAGGLGDLLGSEPLHMGANSDVYVPLMRNPDTDVIAVLVVDGQEVDARRVRFSQN